jgi:DNA-binding beta-propeller fold protein YncE
MAVDGVSDRLRGFWTNQCYPSGLFADAASGKLYCISDCPFLLSVIDPLANSLLGTVPLSGYPDAIGFNPVDHKVYVAFENYSDETKTARPIPGSLNSSTGHHCRCRGSQPSSATPVATVAASTISVVDGVGDTVLTEIKVDGHPTLFAFDATDDVLYAADPGSHQIQVISGKLDRVIDSIQVSEFPSGLAYNNAQHKLYSLGGDSTVTVIDPSTHGVSARIRTAAGLESFVLNSTSSRLYCGNDSLSWVYVIDCAQDKLACAIPVVGPPVALCYDSQHDRLYSVSYGGVLSVIDCTRNSLIGTAPVAACFLCCDPASDAVYCLGDTSITVVDGQTRTIVRTFGAGSGGAVGIASVPGWPYVYAAYDEDSYLAVVRKASGPIEMAVQATPEWQATVVRRRLDWTGTLAVMYDKDGRRVADVHRGGNDVSRPRPGVYFVRQNGVPRGTYARKIVIAR